ncbi:MAG TPA: hypothetical protein VK066_31610 [Chloroflexota bacterium]|nr:hypothetical protein [Chloroflexota bacterium]
MPTATRWERWEFEQLLRSPGLSDDELATLNGQRPAAAIAAMRSAIHGYHAGAATAGPRLTPVQASIVDAYRGQLVCAVCGRPW